MSENFTADKAVGEEFEVRVVEIMKSWLPGCKFVKIGGYWKAFDLKCVDCGVTLECKNDVMSAETGMLCFEVEALNHTEADYWIHRGNLVTWLIEVEYLKRMIVLYGERRMYGYRKTKGGDQNHDLILFNELAFTRSGIGKWLEVKQ